MDFTNEAKGNMTQFILNKRDELMSKYCLDDEQFALMLHWFKNEPKLDEDDNTPVLIVLDESKEAKGKNIEYVSIRFADGLEYARQGGFEIDVNEDLKE